MDMKSVLWGSHIRIFELTRSLGVPLIHGGKFTRLARVIKNTPMLLRADTILLFDYWPLPYDYFLFNSLRKKCDFIFDVADIPYLQPIYFGIHNFSNKTYTKKQRNFFSLISMSSTLLFISPSALKLLNTNLKGKKVIFVPNASNPHFFKKTQIPKKGKKVILYVGGYAPMRGVDLLVEAFNILREKRKDVILKLVGVNIPRKLRKNGIIIETNKFYPDMPKTFSESYLCVIPHRKNPYMDAALPIKLFDAMASARPIVVTNCYEMMKLVKNEKCGLITEDNAKSLAESIDYLLSNDSISREMGEKGREAVEKRHSWHHRAQTIIKNIN